MNIKAGHTIETLTFDIQIPKEKDYHYISDIISSITENELPLFLEALLDEYHLNNQTIQIQQIALDLGDIPLNQTRNQLVTQFKNALKVWFRKTFKNKEADILKDIRTLTSEEREFTLLKYFIASGKIPWWGLQPTFIPDATLKKYIREYSQKTKNLIFELGEKKSNRKRIVYQFKEDTLYQLFGILSPKPSSFFKNYASDLTYIHQKQKVVDEEDQAFKKVLQELILAYLIAHKATSIDQTAFLRRQLLMLSRQYGISYKNILHRIKEAIQLLPKNISLRSGLKAMIYDLLELDFAPIISHQETSVHSFEVYAEILSILYKERPEQLSGKYKSKRERDKLLKKMLKMNKQKTLLILKNLYRKNSIYINQPGFLFSEYLLVELIKTSSSSAIEPALLLIEPLKKLHQKFYIFSHTDLSVKAIVYAHLIYHLQTGNINTNNVKEFILKRLSKTYAIPFQLLHPYLKKSEVQKSQITFESGKALPVFFNQNITLYEEFIKKVETLYPELRPFIHSNTFYTSTLQILADKPETITHFHYFISEISLTFSKRLSVQAKDFKLFLLKDKKSISTKLYKQLSLSITGRTNTSGLAINSINTSNEQLLKLDNDALKQKLNSLFKHHVTFFEKFIHKVTSAYPGLKTYIHSNQFYIFAIQLVSLSPSVTSKMDKWLLKFILHLSQKVSLPVNTFLYPLLSREIIIPDKLVLELRKVYAFLVEIQPTYTDAAEFIFKSDESVEKLIQILGPNLFESASFPSDLDKSTLFLETLWLKEKMILSTILENKFNPILPILLITGLPEEVIQFIQMKIAGDQYLLFQDATNKLSKWIQQHQIIKLPKNKLHVWIKKHSLDYLLQFENRPFNISDYFYFILEKSQKERILHWKGLEQLTTPTPALLEKEIYYFYSEYNQLPIPKKWRDNQFYQDLILHFLKTGKIQPWLSTPYLEINELIYLFKDAVQSENVQLIHAIMKLSFHEEMLQRLHQLIAKVNLVDIINILHKQNPQKSILPFYQAINNLAKESITDLDVEKVIFNLFLRHKIWQRSSETIQYELILDALYQRYNIKISTEKITFSDKALTLDWFIYFLETGIWPAAFNEEKQESYFKYIKSVISDKPAYILDITSNLTYYPFHQSIFKKILSLTEMGVFLKSVLKIKNAESDFLIQLIDKYLIKTSTLFIPDYKLLLLLDALMNFILFSNRKNDEIEQLIQGELTGIIPDINLKEIKSNKPSKVNLWEKELEWMDYYLTYGSVPIESEGITGESWLKIIDKLIKNNARSLLYKLHFWSKSPMKLNRLFELLSQKYRILIISLIHPSLMEHIILMEKAVEAVTGEKIRARIGIKNEAEFMKMIMGIWGKMSKLQPDTTLITYKIFSLYIEKRRLQSNILISLIIEKIKNVSSRQLQIIKNLQKYSAERHEEKVIKKEVPAIQEGIPPASIYVANAGLILLWPFLGRYFRRLNLVGTKDFIDETCRMRGILLTQYLVTGKKESPEYELALNKLLCGAELDMEVDLELDITDEEINLSNSLLTGAITNWEKLKGTRIGTFRETFLQRNGALYYMNNRWELKVEKKAYDLLLETLPWGIQMIQMSWMNERLVVLWR